jgi:hypothetical protein
LLLPPSPRDITVIPIIPIIPDHLLPLVWDMGTHGREPFEGIKDLFLFAILGFIDHPGLLVQIGHPLLGKGGLDDVSGQVFCGLLLTG